ncbi:MAG TPA: histidine--tRNA ligase [Rickettsiales bacterium]|nr:histidine--tRNA ligase [Rickettsiales bacterium]
MKTTFQNVRGTQDFLGEDSKKYNCVIEIAKRNVKSYNFHEIITPIIEFSNLFERNVGEGSDIVMKELYRFEDRGGNMLALRPEFTAGVVRSFLNNDELNQNLPQKLFSYGPVFRYDRPQKGRYRQFNQINCEFIGVKEYLADVEILSLAYKILQDLGLKNITLEINSLGSNACKTKYEEALKKYFETSKDKLSEDSKNRLEKNPLRILDSKEECDKELLKNAPKISDFYTDEEREFFDNILKSLDRMGIKYFANNLLVRGLDYYTSTVFEFTTTDLGAQSTALGGGRYDDLIEQMSGTSIPAVGFGGGVERMMLLLNESLLQKEEVIAIVPVSDNENDFSLDLTNKLRLQGKIVEFIYSGKFKKKMEKANKCGADFLIVVGEDEVKTNKLKIKNLKDGSINDFVL